MIVYVGVAGVIGLTSLTQDQWILPFVIFEEIWIPTPSQTAELRSLSLFEAQFIMLWFFIMKILMDMKRGK